MAVNKFLAESAAQCLFSSSRCVLADSETLDEEQSRIILEHRKATRCSDCEVALNYRSRLLHANDRLDRRHVRELRMKELPLLHCVCVLKWETIERLNMDYPGKYSILDQLVVAIGGPGCFRLGEHELIDVVPALLAPALARREDHWITVNRAEVLGVANMEAICYFLKSNCYHNLDGAFVKAGLSLLCSLEGLGGDVSGFSPEILYQTALGLPSVLYRCNPKK